MFVELLTADVNDGIGVAFTDRNGGHSTGPLASLNLGRTDEDSLPALQANMAALRASIGVQAVAAVHQVHGVAVFDIDADPRDWSADAWLGDRPGEAAQLSPAELASIRLPLADALITARPGIALMIRVADCLPVLFAAGDIIAAAHAGRVGLLAGVLTQTVRAIRARTAEPIRAWLGPHICGDCYEVPAAMADETARTHPAAVSMTTWGTPALDLGAAAICELSALDVKCVRLDPCTLETATLFSHRGDGPAAGRQAGLIWRS